MAAFCCSCGTKYEVGRAKFCSGCGNELQSGSSSTNEPTNHGENPGKPLSFQAFKARKEAARATHFRPPKKQKKAKLAEKEVTIRVGVMQFVPERGCLKIQWGKTLPLSVDKDSTYTAILEKALMKRKAHDRHFNEASQGEEYHLLYPDGSQAIFLPGQPTNFFNLQAYKEDLGKPYNRITLFLCSSSDVRESEGAVENDTHAEFDDDRHAEFDDDTHAEFDDDIHVKFDSNVDDVLSFLEPELQEEKTQPPPCAMQNISMISPSTSHEVVKVECPTCHSKFSDKDIALHADQCAESAHKRLFVEILQDLPSPEPPDELAEGQPLSADSLRSDHEVVELSVAAILKPLVEKLLSPPSRINIRRGHVFKDYVESRKRCAWQKAEKKLKVVFVGEPAEDTGGPRREFFTEVLIEIHSRLLASGVPLASTTALAENEFMFVGNLMAASLLQGGPPPRILAEWVFDYMAFGLHENLSLSCDDLSVEMKGFTTKLYQCSSDEEVQEVLCSDEGMDILESLSFRGVPQKSNMQTKDKILRYYATMANG